MNEHEAEWLKYEQVAVEILNTLYTEFGIKRVEGKQKLIGESGAEWEIEAKGICIDGDGIVIIECRRHTTRRLAQESLGGLAWRIKDTGARSGIIISPLGLQKGAKLVANAGKIVNVIIDANSTPQNFAIEFLQKIFLGVTLKLGTINIVADMSLIRRCTKCGQKFDESICEKCNCE